MNPDKLLELKTLQVQRNLAEEQIKHIQGENNELKLKEKEIVKELWLGEIERRVPGCVEPLLRQEDITKECNHAVDEVQDLIFNTLKDVHIELEEQLENPINEGKERGHYSISQFYYKLRKRR
jgi:hypothetical protein